MVYAKEDPLPPKPFPCSGKHELVFVCVPRVVSAFDALCNTPAGHSAARSAEEEEAMVLRAIQASARLPRTWALAYVLANT